MLDHGNSAKGATDVLSSGSDVNRARTRHVRAQQSPSPTARSGCPARTVRPTRQLPRPAPFAPADVAGVCPAACAGVRPRPGGARGPGPVGVSGGARGTVDVRVSRQWQNEQATHGGSGDGQPEPSISFCTPGRSAIGKADLARLQAAAAGLLARGDRRRRASSAHRRSGRSPGSSAWAASSSRRAAGSTSRAASANTACASGFSSGGPDPGSADSSMTTRGPGPPGPAMDRGASASTRP